jgi:hypothetical protein
VESSDEVRDLSIQLYRAIEAGDTEFLDRHVSRRAEAVFVGTDPDEWWEDADALLQAVKAQAAATSGPLKVIPGRARAYREGNVGWMIDNGPTFELSDGNRVLARSTLIFIREDSQWRLVHAHNSIGVLNEDVFGEDITA